MPRKICQLSGSAGLVVEYIIDNYYNIYRTLKKKNYKYSVKIYWIPSELKYRNTKFMYR